MELKKIYCNIPKFYLPFFVPFIREQIYNDLSLDIVKDNKYYPLKNGYRKIVAESIAKFLQQHKIKIVIRNISNIFEDGFSILNTSDFFTTLYFYAQAYPNGIEILKDSNFNKVEKEFKLKFPLIFKIIDK